MFSPQMKPERKVALSRTPWEVPLASRQFIQPQFSCQDNLLMGLMSVWAREGMAAAAIETSAVRIMRWSLSGGLAGTGYRMSAETPRPFRGVRAIGGGYPE